MNQSIKIKRFLLPNFKADNLLYSVNEAVCSRHRHYIHQKYPHFRADPSVPLSLIKLGSYLPTLPYVRSRSCSFAAEVFSEANIPAVRQFPFIIPETTAVFNPWVDAASFLKNIVITLSLVCAGTGLSSMWTGPCVLDGQDLKNIAAPHRYFVRTIACS